MTELAVTGNTFAERLKNSRKKAGLTQNELANAVGVSQTLIYSLEKGLSRDTKYMLELAAMLDVTIHWLKYGDESKHAKASPQAAEKLDEPVSLPAALRAIADLTEQLEVERAANKALIKTIKYLTREA